MYVNLVYIIYCDTHEYYTIMNRNCKCTSRYFTNRRGNQEWTIQRYKQHWAHKTQDEDKPGNYKTRGMEM